MADRSNRLLADDNVGYAGWQLYQAHLELEITGPLCDAHWRKARKRLEATIERAQTAITFVDLALEPFGAEMQAEKDKIITRRH